MKNTSILLLAICAALLPNLVFGQNTDSTQPFLDLFKKADWNGMQIYSPRYGVEDNKFEGEAIPKEFYKYFESQKFVY